MRVSYSYSLRDRNRIVYADDETFYARLPRDLAEPLRATVEAQALSAEENLEVFRILSDEFAEAGDVAIQLAPLNFQWCSDGALERVAALSHERGALVHMHLLETPYQRAYARKRTGGSALGHLDRIGLLNERMTLGHGVWTTADNLDLIAARNTSICHNCSSNLRLQSGWKYWTDHKATTEMLVREQAYVGMFTDGRIRRAIDAGAPVRPHIPKEGAMYLVDSLAIPSTSTNPEEAHVFINWMLKPEISAGLSETIFYDAMNSHARPDIPPNILETFDLPNQDELVILKDVPPATKKRLDELWLGVKLS